MATKKAKVIKTKDMNKRQTKDMLFTFKSAMKRRK